MISDSSALQMQFAFLTNSDHEMQSEPEIIFCRSNLSMDMYWSPSFGAIPSLHSLVLIDNEYIGCILKHLSTTHLRALVIGKLTENLNDKFQDDDDEWMKRSKYILKTFPMIEWEPLHNHQVTENGDDDPCGLIGCQRIMALGYRLKIPLIDDCVVTSALNQTVVMEEEDGFELDDCSAVDITDHIVECKKMATLQSNSNIKQSHYMNYKKKLISNAESPEWDDSNPLILHRMCPSGIRSLDLLNPLTKHGLNLIITPKQEHNAMQPMFKLLAQNWSQKDGNHTIYADVFEDYLDAMALRHEIMDSLSTSKSTLIAGHCSESDWYKVQMAITAATLGKHAMNKGEDTLVLYPNGNVINKSVNNLHRTVLGGLSRLKFEQNDEIGHKAYDWTKQRSKRGKPEAATEFYLNWGVEPVLDGATFVIGLEMESTQIEDIRIQPTAYFPWADTVAVFDGEGQLDVAHSSSKILSEIRYSDLSPMHIEVLNAIRRLHADCQLLNEIGGGDDGVINLWNDIFDEDDSYSVDGKQGMNGVNGYQQMMEEVYGKLEGQLDHDGNELLRAQCLGTAKNEDTENGNMSMEQREQRTDDELLMDILGKEVRDDDKVLMQRLDALREQYAGMNVNGVSPEIVISSMRDHGGFVKTVKLNMKIKMFTDDRCRYGMGIGMLAVLFINHKPVCLPKKYGEQKKKKQGIIEEATMEPLEIGDGDGNGKNEDKQKQMRNAFERLSKFCFHFYAVFGNINRIFFFW